MVEWDKFSKGFLAGWIKTLLESMDKHLDEDTKKKIMGETGSYCAQQHIIEVLVDIKKNTKNFDEFLEKVNEQLKGTSWTKINEDTLIVTYSKCYCPMIELDMYRTPVQCNCSVGWLKKNLETVLEKAVDVELVQSVLQDGNQCEFKVKI
jgi:hypothetical protein